MSTSRVSKVALAFSGGLDTSVAVPWIKQTYGAEVVCVVVDVGQGGEDLDEIEDRAKAAGAISCHVVDVRREFVEDFVWPTLRAGAIYGRKYLLGTAMARPLIAREVVRAARREGCDAIGHGCTGKGNDQVRFELTYMALAPKLKIIAPWKDPSFELTSREAAVDYAKKHKIPIDQSKKKIYSRDRNIWHISHEGAELEDPANEPLDRMFTISRPASKAPNKAEYVEIGFEEGVPVKLNGKRVGGVKLIETLNVIGGKHGVGQTDLVENRLVGIKSRGVYETPGGTILMAAHDWMESLTLDRETLHYKQQISLKYADMVYNGQWFTQLREALDAFVDITQRNVTGSVRVKLYKGRCTMAGVKSPMSLYSTDLASFKMGAEYDPTDADGFIRLFGLPMKVAAAVKQGLKKK